ncbi:MAG TPA: hypothetical protein VJ124_21795 [Pyrinomonadaceae bacterium]|nr:hypothetical protein [Pyrinomonadaceae bacterium]
MRDQEIDEQDLAFVRELGKHVNKWVAILNYGTATEAIVASGETISEARQAAELKGFTDVIFFKSPSGERSFVP